MRHNFNACFQYMLELEGGYVLHHNEGEAAHTYAGIYRAAHPDWLGWLYIDNGDEVPEYVVLDFYEENFWDRIHGDELPEGLELQVFCMAVNAGVHQASVLLQRVLNATEDGIIGSRTVAKAQLYDINEVGEQVVLDKLSDYCRESIIYYGAIVTDKPEKSIYYNGWLNRALGTLVTASNRLIPF